MPTPVKAYKTYDEQVDLLASRGMDIGDRDAAIQELQHINYYRLSGYWYAFRRQGTSGREDTFYAGTTFQDVVRLYTFDASLRTATFASLAPIELALRALIGHALGTLHECAHLEPKVLGPRASQGGSYATWIKRYKKSLADSKEDFVKHHQAKYAGTLPVWAAVEVLDWGALTYLYGFSPRHIQNDIADKFGLTAPQLESWMKSLNVVRNICAHHGRLFNKVHAIKPKLPAVGHLLEVDKARQEMNRTFGQLTLIQHMLRTLDVGRRQLLPAVLRTYPDVKLLPISHVGAPPQWAGSALWK
ncbi:MULTISPECIES: Abi family protein [Paenarthrobacter]|uniref:Abi family protein n=1 Tax=Paenarthrobacter TaxID=1742992 RepID=UPI00074D4AAC|nr:Abi family protein [Paenarthrobacter ureafaciens]AMB42112.1 CAAX protease [Arthrobacter sp. ATCC 21022]